MGLWILSRVRSDSAAAKKPIPRDASGRARRFHRESLVEESADTVHPDDIRYAPLIPLAEWRDLSRVFPQKKRR